MTKVARAGQLPMSNGLHFGGVAAGGGGSKLTTGNLKRKTPSELRGELLKQKNTMELTDESSFATSFMWNADGAVSGPKKPDSSRAPRFTRLDEHYPVTKINRLLRRKESPKENIPSKHADSLKNSSLPVDLLTKHQEQNSCLDNNVASKGGYGSSYQSNLSTEKGTTNTFKNVRELSVGDEMLYASSSVDMGKALRGLVSCESHAASAPLADSVNRTGNNAPQSFCSEIHLPGHNIPLDLTLKTNMRLMLSSSVDWFHRLINGATLNDMGLLLHGGSQNQSMTSSKPTSTGQITNHGTFHSWVHPESTLPRAVISALALVPERQMDFLSKRQQAWEDSLRSLYYNLRKKLCKIFYVCSVQFVVMFTISEGPNKTKCSCYAYVSQSTRNLRSLLKEHDISFSMPLCRSKVEEVTIEDIVELSQIEKHNLGKTRTMESMTGVDNTPQSLLMFAGKNVHGLYDFLLNYRSFCTSLTGSDVPVLYSPVPFENAALSAPEVRCKQVRRVDYISSHPMDSNMDIEHKRNSAGICYGIEVTDAYLPPWVISGICSAMCSKGDDFQVSFTTEPSSMGLNVGLDIATDQPSEVAEADKPLQENGSSFGISNSTLSLQRRSAFLKGLKFGNSSYTAILSPIE